jgi:hypothetical protein
MKRTDPQPSKMPHLRRSQRVWLNLPIEVFRERAGKHFTSEETNTLLVSAHGALIQLALTVEIGQLLGIKNTQTIEEVSCRVVHVGRDQPGKREVGVEFELPSPRFWRIAFPPSDWTPRSPDAKAPTRHSPGGRARQEKTSDAPAEPEQKLVSKLPGSLQS